MANTYTQIYIQTVFAVQYRQAALREDFRQKVFGYIGELINDNGHKTLIVNGVCDHVHCFIGLKPTQSISDLMKEVKSRSSKWINQQKFTNHRFEWQEGYGAFSYGRSQMDSVYKYIQNQEQHHSNRSFREEYLQFLEIFEIPFDERYIFKDMV